MIKKIKPVELSVVLPCRNEEDSIGNCIKEIKKVLKDNNIKGEIIVSDSSTDSSAIIAKKSGVILVKHNKPGYGRAYLEGFKKAKGDYIFCADPDGSYGFYEIPKFLNELRKGNDFVIGNRFQGIMSPRAMAWHRRYIGNPLITLTIRLVYKIKLGDVLCGMRAYNKKALRNLHLTSEGMEFAAESVIKAHKNNLRTKELPINYYERCGHSKLKPLSDGFKHLKYILFENA